MNQGRKEGGSRKTSEFLAWFKNSGFWVTLAIEGAYDFWVLTTVAVAKLMEISFVESVGSRAVPASEDVSGRSTVLRDSCRCVRVGCCGGSDGG